MNTKVKAGFVAAILFAALFFFESVIYSQIPTPLTSPARSMAADKAKTDDEKTAKDADQTPAPKPETEILKREELTGDWGGTRTHWKKKGVETEFRLNQFYQGLTSGGVTTGKEYLGKFGAEGKFDFGKLWGWKFWSAEIKAEVRFGGNAIFKAGALNPVNTAEISPGSDGTVFAITSLNVTKMFPLDLAKGDLIVVSVGRFNLLDSIDENFFAGSGTARFFNIAQNGPLTAARQVPFITNGALFALVRGGEPRFTFALLDPNDHSTDPGIKNLFGDGVTFSPAYNIPTKYFGKTAKHTFGGAVTTKSYTPFDQINSVIIPGPPIAPIQPKSGSWSVNYTFRQYIVEREKNDGWGFFGQASTADRRTSPITHFLTVGLGGNALFDSRPRDQFGIAYAYTNLSKDFTDLVNPITVGPARPEHEFEVFYNFHFTPWFRMTTDLQIIRPARAIASTAVVPGVRFELVF